MKPLTDAQKLKGFDWLRKHLIAGYSAFPEEEMAKARDTDEAGEIWNSWLIRNANLEGKR